MFNFPFYLALVVVFLVLEFTTPEKNWLDIMIRMTSTSVGDSEHSLFLLNCLIHL